MAIIEVNKYSESNYDTDVSIGYDGATIAIDRIGCGVATGSNGGTLHSVKFYLKKTNSPTGNAYAQIISNQPPSVPDTNLLATSDAVDVSGISSSYGLITFYFSGDERITLENDTTYTVVLKFVGGTSTNHIEAGVDNSSPSFAGTTYTYNDVTDAWATQTYDLCFYLYKITPIISPLPSFRTVY